ncbi:hypothetical protein H0H92_006696 [Tricholoma furcatifolium]|nr:hypothetical protein H0H92_006696 [Tricholoma furcatifolium]
MSSLTSKPFSGGKRVYGYLFTIPVLNEVGIKMKLGKVDGTGSLSTAVVTYFLNKTGVNAQSAYVQLDNKPYVCLAVASNDPSLYLPETPTPELLEKFKKGLGQSTDPKWYPLP